MKDEIKKELEELSPMLAKMKKQPEGFSVPDDYFAKMETDIWDLVQPEDPIVAQAPSQTSWLDNIIQQIGWLLQPRMAMSLASVAILIVAAIMLLPNADTADVNALAGLTADDATDYMAAHIDEFDTETLIEFAMESDLTTNSAFFEESEMNNLINDMENENIDLETLEGLL